eukprot:2583540-Amphidinium_carterae.1
MLLESELKKVPTPHTFVVNVPSQVAHKASTPTSMPDPSLWNTMCGWRFVHARFTLYSELPAEAKPCQRCFGFDASSSK